MRLSTMTNLLYEKREDGKSYLDSVRRTRAIGFKVMDFNMCPMQRGSTEMCLDNWEELTYEIANEAAKIGIEFSQAHLPYPKAVVRRKTPFDIGCEQNEYFVKMTERAIRISGILGVKWAVVHPVQTIDGVEFSRKADIEYNHFIYDKYLELASSLGVGLAFENMADIDAKRRFGVTPEELIALIDSYNTPFVGACWDFGHANRVFYSPENELRAILPYLKATHVDDNIGLTDLHTLPYLGTVKWEEIMKILKDSDYQGDFNFELKLTSNMPSPLKEPAVRFAYELGTYLLSLAKKEQ